MTTTKKPKAKLTGADGNIFTLIGIASKSLKKEGLDKESKEMTDRVFNSASYSEALKIIGEYCEIV